MDVLLVLILLGVGFGGGIFFEARYGKVAATYIANDEKRAETLVSSVRTAVHDEFAALKTAGSAISKTV